jgi:hypothetical protein
LFVRPDSRLEEQAFTSNPTPKAFANASPGLELATTLGIKEKKERPTLKALARVGKSGSPTLSALELWNCLRSAGLFQPWE